jgi:hypothetical protein
VVKLSPQPGRSRNDADVPSQPTGVGHRVQPNSAFLGGSRSGCLSTANDRNVLKPQRARLIDIHVKSIIAHDCFFRRIDIPIRKKRLKNSKSG